MIKDTSLEIARLCESCRDQIAGATKAGQQTYAEQLLHLLGWDQPIPFTPREGAGALSAVPYLLRGGGQTNVAVYFVAPGTLEPPSSVIGRGLDFCPATKTLVHEARACNVQYMLATDFYRSYFYDPRSEELLLHADDPRAFNQEIAPALRRPMVERGALEELRRQPRSAVARQLREWGQRWIETFAQDTQLREQDAWLIVDRLVVLGFLFDREILRRTKWRLQQRFFALVELAESNRIEGVGSGLLKLFYDMGFDWRMDLFGANPELERALRHDHLVAGLLREFSRLARTKFHMATILESFNHGDPSEKMRVRMVPEENEERDRYLFRQSIETIDDARIEIDISEEGYRALYGWFDKVVALYERLEVDFDARTYRNVPMAQELDLFTWSDMDAHRPSACSDKFAHACEHGFGVYYNGPLQLRIARLLLTLHLISRYDQNRQPVDRFPGFAKVFMPRPKVLTSRHVMRATASLTLADDPLNYPAQE